MSEKINVKQRLLLARKEILETKVVKQGKNKFSNYDYFTPSQITTLVTKACLNNDLMTVFRVIKIEDNYRGILTVEDVYTDDKVEFSTPTAMPDLKATNITQKLGGMLTYTQRYLEQIAFGITDNNLDLDSQDNTGPKETPKPKKAKLSKERFESALEAITKGTTTAEKVKTQFQLDETQLNLIELNALNNTTDESTSK